MPAKKLTTASIRPALWALMLAFGAALSGCATSPTHAGDVTGPLTWGAADNVKQFENLYFSEQPDAESLAVARANGVTTIVNLRAPTELDWDEASAVAAAGMQYINIPIFGPGDALNADALAAVSRAVNVAGNDRVLIHCATGNRAAAWLATDLVANRNYSQSDAIEIAEQAGLTSDGLKQRLQSFFNASQN